MKSSNILVSSICHPFPKKLSYIEVKVRDSGLAKVNKYFASKSTNNMMGWWGWRAPEDEKEHTIDWEIGRHVQMRHHMCWDTYFANTSAFINISWRWTKNCTAKRVSWLSEETVEMLLKWRWFFRFYSQRNENASWQAWV